MAAILNQACMVIKQSQKSEILQLSATIAENIKLLMHFLGRKRKGYFQPANEAWPVCCCGGAFHSS